MNSDDTFDNIHADAYRELAECEVQIHALIEEVFSLKCQRLDSAKCQVKLRNARTRHIELRAELGDEWAEHFGQQALYEREEELA